MPRLYDLKPFLDDGSKVLLMPSIAAFSLIILISSSLSETFEPRRLGVYILSGEAAWPRHINRLIVVNN